MPIIDSQVHCYLPNTPQRPWAHPHDSHRPHVTGDEMVMAMDTVGVDGAILVSTKGMYDYDPSYVVEVQRAFPGRFAIVRPADPNNPAVADAIAEWKSTPGSVAVRLMIKGVAGVDPNSSGINAVAREAARVGFPLNFQCAGSLDAAMQVIDRHPNTRFVIDHLGIRQPRKTADPWDELPKVLDLARRPNAAIKISGACSLSAQALPHEDIWEPLEKIFKAWGLQRCLWGSDWTRTYRYFPYINAVAPFLLTPRLSDSDRAMLMGGACAKAYGWSPTK